MKSLLVCLLLAVLSTNSHALFGSSKSSDHKKKITQNKITLDSEKNTINIFEENVRSVVNISTIQIAHSRISMFFDLPEQGMKVPSGQGSGFVWDDKGHIVTNYHVVANADDFVISFHKDKKKYSAELVGSYPEKDIAVLKLKEMPKKLHPIKITDSDTLRVGQKALAIGSPFGLDNTITTGIISSKDRSINGIANIKINGMIQTDCSINPGNSGGPLYNSNGNVIGMNTMIFSHSGSSAGVGFAVPSNTINDFVPRLITYGKIKRPGIGIKPLSSDYRSRIGIEDGVVIQEVIPRSGAASAGLKGMQRGRRGYRLGDIILKVGDKYVNDLGDIFNALEAYKIGQKAEVTYMRAKNCRDFDILEEEIKDIVNNKRYKKSGCINKANIKLMELPS
jgi:S1-C subfamily serine protease